MQRIIRMQKQRIGPYPLQKQAYDLFFKTLKRTYIQFHQQKIYKQYVNKDWHQHQQKAIQKWCKQEKTLQNLSKLAIQYHIPLPTSRYNFLRSQIVSEGKTINQNSQFLKKIQIGVPRYKKKTKGFKQTLNYRRNFTRRLLGKKYAITQNPYYNKFVQIYKSTIGMGGIKTQWTKIQNRVSQFADRHLARLQIFPKGSKRAICPKCGLILSSKSMRNHLTHRHSFQVKQDIIQVMFSQKGSFNYQQQGFLLPAVVTGTTLPAGLYASQLSKYQSLLTKQFRQAGQFIFDQKHIIHQIDIQKITEQGKQSINIEVQNDYPQQIIKQWTVSQVKQLLKERKFISLTSVCLNINIFQEEKSKIQQQPQNLLQAWRKQVHVIKQFGQHIQFINGVLTIIPPAVSMKQMDQFQKFKGQYVQSFFFNADMSFTDYYQQQQQVELNFDCQKIIKQSKQYVPQVLLQQMKKKRSKFHVIGPIATYYKTVRQRCSRKAFYLSNVFNQIKLGLLALLKYIVFYFKQIGIKARQGLTQILPKLSHNERIQAKANMQRAQSGYLPNQFKWKQIFQKYRSTKEQIKKIQEQWCQMEISQFLITTLSTQLRNYQNAYRNVYHIMSLVYYVDRIVCTQGKQKIMDQSVLKCIGFAAPIIEDDDFYNGHFVASQYWNGTSTKQPLQWKKYQMTQVKLLDYDIQIPIPKISKKKKEQMERKCRQYQMQLQQ